MDIETITSFGWNVVMDATYTFRFEFLAALLFVVGINIGKLRAKKKPEFGKNGKHKFFSGPGNKGSPGRPQRVNKKVSEDSAATALLSKAPLGAIENIDPALLRNISWLLAQVNQLCPNQASQALQLYRAAVNAELNLAEASADERHQLFYLLVPAAIRSNQTSDVTAMFKDLKERGFGINAELLTSAVKLHTSKMQFKECLVMFDSACADPKNEIADKSLWSCLLFCAMETKAFHRCAHLISRLRACGSPSPQDYNNMLKLAARNNDWEQSLKLIQEMHDSNVEVYNVQYNTTLATCVESGKIEEACQLLEKMETEGARGDVTDVITYNTVMKAFAKAGKIDECFELLERLNRKGMTPSQVTYGILVDCCINLDQVDRAMQIFQDMSKGGCQLNTILYTVLIKGFIRAGNREQAMTVYNQMRAEKDATISPDLITFSILIKANCDDNKLEEALTLLSNMTDLRLKPDEVIFNNLIAGCGQNGNGRLGKQLYEDMQKCGLRPSNVTFSIMIRMFQKCKLLDEAFLFIKTEPAKHKVVAETRLFVQLIQACVRGRQGKRALEVYETCCSCAKPSAQMNNTIINTCINVNMLDTAADIIEIAAKWSSKVDSADIHSVADSAWRKGKKQILQSCVTTLQALGHAVDPRFIEY